MHESEEVTPGAARRKFPWGMLTVAILFVVIPFISWYGTWFGRPLSDSKIEEYLNDDEKPRHIQHALEQIVGRIETRDESVRRWYPKIRSLATHSVPEIREWAAVAMGHDSTNEDFHADLRSLLKDENPIVRRTAALWLVRFGDASGRDQLVEMLKPFTLRADSAGTVEVMIGAEGSPLPKGAPFIRIKQYGSHTSELTAPLDSRLDTLLVEDGSRIEVGEELVVLSPGVKQVENALVALSLVGQPEDVQYAKRYTSEIPGMPERIRKQAAMTIESILKRASATGSM